MLGGMTALLDSTIADRARSEIENAHAFYDDFAAMDPPAMLEADYRAHRDGVVEAAKWVLDCHPDEDTMRREAIATRPIGLTPIIGDPDTAASKAHAYGITVTYIRTGQGARPSEDF